MWYGRTTVGLCVVQQQERWLKASRRPWAGAEVQRETTGGEDRLHNSNRHLVTAARKMHS
jgi:hypothetical protein